MINNIQQRLLATADPAAPKAYQRLFDNVERTLVEPACTAKGA